MWFLSQLAPWIALDLKGGDLPIVAARRPSAVNAHFSDRETFAADGPDQWRFA